MDGGIVVFAILYTTSAASCAVAYVRNRQLIEQRDNAEREHARYEVYLASAFDANLRLKKMVDSLVSELEPAIGDAAQYRSLAQSYLILLVELCDDIDRERDRRHAEELKELRKQIFELLLHGLLLWHAG